MRRTGINNPTTIGRAIIIGVGIFSMFYSVYFALTPLQGEEAYAGTTYSNLQATDPKLANILWHDGVALGSVSFAVSLLSVVLAWKGLPRAWGLAWNSLLILWAGFLAGLILAHFPIGNTSIGHIGPVVIALSADALGLALTAGPLFSKTLRHEA